MPVGRGNVVTDWAAIVQPALAAGRPPASTDVLHALVQLAVYDAVMAIEATHEPSTARISAPPGTDMRAAVATAAWRTAPARIDASQAASLDTSYSSYIAGIADRRSKEDGIQVGAAAAAALLTLRKHDGYDDVVEYQCKSNLPGIGEFEPIKGCGTQPVDPKLPAVTPYTFIDPGRFGPAGPRKSCRTRAPDGNAERGLRRLGPVHARPQFRDVAHGPGGRAPVARLPRHQPSAHGSRRRQCRPSGASVTHWSWFFNVRVPDAQFGRGSEGLE